MEGIGNDIANQYWEANMRSGNKINSSASQNQRKAFVKEKYIKRKFAPEGELDPVAQYQKDLREGNTGKKKKKAPKKVVEKKPNNVQRMPQLNITKTES